MEYKNSIPGRYEGFGEPIYPNKVVTSQYVPGFDGTKLAVDVVRPADKDGNVVTEKLPVIMYISRGGRYGQNALKGDEILDYCIPHGYIGVVPEMRGCGVSYGINNSFASIENRQDVNAVLEWIAKQDWCDGQVCTFGGSNKGLIQFASAVRKPAPSPLLKGITPVVANADFYYQDYINGLSAIPMRKKNKVSGSKQTKEMKTKEEFLADPAIKPVDEDVNGDMAYEAYSKDQFGNNVPFMKSLMLPHMCRDDENPNLGGEKTNITIPPITDIDVFKKTNIKVHQFAGFLESGPFGQLMAAKEWNGSIVVGPWDHHESRKGTTAFPDAGPEYLTAEHLKEFDYIMKGVKNGFGERPRFVYYTLNAEQGKNWRVSESWPIENAAPTRMYLTPAKSGTAGSINDGSLAFTKPEEETAQPYKVDTSIHVFDDGEGKTMDRMHLWWDGDMQPGVDNKGLTFTSKPLYERYTNEMSGCTTVDLWATCSQNDADFICYLEEVLENGESHYVSMGCLRASHRTTEPREAWNESGAYYHPCMRGDMEKCLEEGMDKPVHLQFHIEPTSYKFHRHSRIRLTITCADKDTFQHKYDEENLPEIHLYQGGDHASFIELPFIEDVENVYNGTLEKGEYKGPATLYFFDEKVFLYYNGTWENFEADKLTWEIEDGKAVFSEGFKFTLEGKPVFNGILQDYKGGDPIVIPFPAKRRKIVAVEPVRDDHERLYVPSYKTVYVEEFAKNFKNTDGKRPVLLYMHGYSGTPSALSPLELGMIEHDYVIIGIDMRNYPPNLYPDYLYDEKGCVRYIRAHADEFKIDADRIGVVGRSLGGNGLLLLAATGGCDASLEGTVGGNLEYSSRVQAAVIGYGWVDLLTMGDDLIDENSIYAEEDVKAKWENTNGPMAPAGSVIGFTGKGKGLQVIIDYEKAKKAGGACDPELEEVLKQAKGASPMSHITPEMPPSALFGGLNDVGIDIAHEQSVRTLRKLGECGVDGYLFSNTNGRYGKRKQIIDGILSFLEDYLLKEPAQPKLVTKPGKCEYLRNGSDKKAAAPMVIKKEDALYVSCEILKSEFGVEAEADITENGTGYIRASKLGEYKLGLRTFAKYEEVALLPASEIPPMKAKKRN